jgi:alcohol dehydrogenase class IV
VGLQTGAELGDAIRALTRSLGIPGSLREAGYRVRSVDDLVNLMVRSPFNRSSPYAPTPEEYWDITMALVA